MKSKMMLNATCLLSLAATAGAGVILAIDGNPIGETTIRIDDELTIGVVNDSSAPIDQLFLMIPWNDPGEWILPNIQPGGIIPGHLINTWGWEYIEVEGIARGWMWPGAPVIEPTDEIMGEFGFRCTGLGDVSIDLFDMNFEMIHGVEIHQIPEPITLTILGLGAIVLRRRSRIS